MKDLEEKSDDKSMDKSKSETDEDTKDTMNGIDDDSQQGDSIESKVNNIKILCILKNIFNVFF